MDAPAHYLRQCDYMIYLESKDNGRNPSNTFDGDATFYLRKDKYFSGFYSFESSNFPSHYIRHTNYRLKIDMETDADLFKNDASFKITPSIESPGNSVCIYVIMAGAV